MKLSENTLTVLKNFSNINEGLLLRKGTLQRTMAPDKSVLVEVELEETMPNDFGIYDLPLFLGNVTTLNDPELTFNDDAVIINDGSIKLTYRKSAPSMITSPPDKKLELKEINAQFNLSNAGLQKLLKIAHMNNHGILSVVGKEGKINLHTSDGTDTSSLAEMYLADFTGEDFEIKFKTQHLNMIPGDYTVKVMFGTFATFESADGKLKYFVALLTK